MSQNELMQMAGNTKFGFLKLPASKAVFSEGDICQQLFFLVSGQLLLTTRSADGGYSLTEHIAAPWMMQPEVLFGLQPRYSSTCTTATLCHLITLSKDEVSRLAEQFLVVRLNLLNLLSTKMQRQSRQQWRSAPRSLRERFVRFLLDRSVYPAGAKELNVIMTRLATELGDSRLDTSHMLRELQQMGMLQLNRGRISIPSLEKLITCCP
jgi:CRP-like cAMP-binding protein